MEGREPSERREGLAEMCDMFHVERLYVSYVFCLCTYISCNLYVRDGFGDEWGAALCLIPDSQTSPSSPSS